MDQKVITSIVQDLEKELDYLTKQNLDIYFHIQQAIGLCRIAYNDLKKIIVQQGFRGIQEEILFFKTIKPQVCSKLTFYRRLAKIISNRPKCTTENQINYLKVQISRLHEFFTQIQDFYEYYSMGLTHQDELFFTRRRNDLVLNNYNYEYLVDPDFSTIHDKTVAKIIAYQNLEKYLDNEITKLQNLKPEFNKQSESETDIRKIWTGSQVALPELLYALKESGVISNGQTSVKELYEIFSKILKLPEIDLYRTYQDIQKRKKNKTVFLDKLKEALLRKLDESDEYKP